MVSDYHAAIGTPGGRVMQFLGWCYDLEYILLIQGTNHVFIVPADICMN